MKLIPFFLLNYLAMSAFCSNFGTPLPKINFGWVSTPNIQSHPAEHTQNEQKMKMGKPFTECPIMPFMCEHLSA